MFAIIPGPKPKALPVFQPELVDPHYEWVGDSLYIWSSRDVNYSGNIIVGMILRVYDRPTPSF
jgi:hypothetical protein